MSASQLDKRDRYSTGPELLRYFRWALIGIGLGEDLAILRPDSEQLSAWQIRVTRVARRYLTGAPFSQFRPSPRSVLRTPEEYFRTEEADVSVELQLQAYGQMLAAMVLGITGNFEGHEWLGAALVTDHLNRKLTVSRFLSLLTEGAVGSSEPHMPTRSDVLSWAHRIATNDVEARSRLAELAELNAF